MKSNIARYAGIRKPAGPLFRGALAGALLIALAAPLLLCMAPVAEGAPLPPVGIEVFARQEDRGLRVTLSWVHGQECAGYRVYRSKSEGGRYDQVGGISAESFAEYPFFLDEDVVGGATYFYRVAAVDANLNEGPMSAALKAETDRYRRASYTEKRILVSLADQHAYFFENGTIVNILRCSTGAGGTPTGNYRIMAHRGWVSGCAYWMDWRPNYGMHAWPSYLGSYEQNLGVHPCSHGCVRLHPLEAYWPYNWAPDGTPFTVIAGSYGQIPWKGASCSRGATRPERNWYFAEGFTNHEFNEYLLFFNPGTEPVNALTTYYPEGQAPVVENYFLPPGTRQTIFVNAVSGVPYAIGHGITVKADGPVVVQQSEYYNYYGRRGGHTTMGAPRLSRDWYFAEGYTGGVFDTYLLVFNPNRDKAANVKVFYSTEHDAPYMQEFTLLPCTRATTLVNALPGMLGKGFSAHVVSDVPLVAQRTEFFAWDTFAHSVNGGEGTMGITRPAKTWYLAEGSTSGFFTEYVLVLNPTETPANVVCEFCTSSGPRYWQFAVAPFARYTLAVDSIPGLESADTGAIINSDVDVVVERSMYTSRDSRRGGHVANAVSESSQSWYFAEGFTGGTFDEWLSVMNPNAAPANAWITFHREDGSTVGYTVGIAPKTRINVHPDEIPGLEFAGSAVEIHTDLPVVAEQSHYFCVPR